MTWNFGECLCAVGVGLIVSARWHAVLAVPGVVCVVVGWVWLLAARERRARGWRR